MSKSTYLQKTLDNLFAFIFLWAIPKNIKPNWVTAFRILLVPVVYYLLLHKFFLVGFLLFTVAAITDFIDGAMARKRNQITDLGIVLDPIADKLLICVMLLFIGTKYFIVKIFLFLIFAETIVAIWNYFFFRSKNQQPKESNFYGKLKTVAQNLCVIIFIIGLITKQNVLITISTSMLFVALFFAGISTVQQIKDL